MFSTIMIEIANISTSIPADTIIISLQKPFRGGMAEIATAPIEIIILVIGFVFYRATGDLADYNLGGRRLGATVAALSAGASDMSGWLLLGLPGALYALGMNQVWIAVGLSVGAYLNWQFVAKRLRNHTELLGNAGSSYMPPDSQSHQTQRCASACNIMQ